MNCREAKRLNVLPEQIKPLKTERLYLPIVVKVRAGRLELPHLAALDPKSFLALSKETKTLHLQLVTF